MLTPEERDDLVERLARAIMNEGFIDRIAQAVMDRIAARDQVDRLSDLIVEQILAQKELAPPLSESGNVMIVNNRDTER